MKIWKLFFSSLLNPIYERCIVSFTHLFINLLTTWIKKTFILISKSEIKKKSKFCYQINPNIIPLKNAFRCYIRYIDILSVKYPVVYVFIFHYGVILTSSRYHNHDIAISKPIDFNNISPVLWTFSLYPPFYGVLSKSDHYTIIDLRFDWKWIISKVSYKSIN